MKDVYPKWEFTVKDGKVQIRMREQFDLYVATHFEGKKGILIARPYRKPRSTGQEDETGNQNGYYWAVIVRMLAAEMGMFDHEVHDMLRHKFLLVGKERDGRRWEVARSTADLSTVEFEDYCSKIRMWAGTPDEICENGLLIPLPNEVAWRD